MTRRVAVTGAGGFIGSTVVAALHAAGAEVRALLWPPEVPLPAVPAGVATRMCDITDVAALREGFAGADVVVHAAGPPSVFESLREPTEFVRIHVLGTACVLEAMRAAGVPAIVYLSSAEVYAVPLDGSISETDPIEPRSPYGAAKVGAEAVLRAATASFGLHGYLMRPFSVYGPGMTRMSVLGSIVAQVKDGDVVALADLAPVRDYCYVQDVADAVLSACGRPSTGMIAMNVATGVPTSVRDLVETVGEVLNRDFDIRLSGEGQRPAGVHVARMVADVSAIERALGWRPRYDLRTGLTATLTAMGVA